MYIIEFFILNFFFEINKILEDLIIDLINNFMSCIELLSF